jgi:hypothetical protein
MNAQVVGPESMEEENMSQYAEGVFDLLREIFNVEVEINRYDAPVTKSRTKSETKNWLSNKENNCGRRSMQENMLNIAKRDVVKYGSINVRSLVMKDDKFKREVCGATAAAIEWVYIRVPS